MRIAVTGGTGYVGAHIVSGLLAAGHQVHLLVEPDWSNDMLMHRLNAAGELSLLRGDLRSADSVDGLLDGCDAVIHGAGVVGTDDRKAALMWDINAYASERIMLRGIAAGLDPVVLISSYSALFPPPGPVIGPDSPTAQGKSAYAQTKSYADRVARRLQRDGAPVVVTYPSSVVGPAFYTPPGITEQGWGTIVRLGAAPRLGRAGMMMIDVRDVALVHERLMCPGRGPKRYLCGGQMLTFDQMITALERGSGRRIRRIAMNPTVFRLLGRVSDLAAPLLPLGSGFSYEAAQLITAAIPTDDSETLRDLDLTWRSASEAIVATFAETAVI
ncbi:NAD-dependent epimerase/dehydratase family protein [Mycobacterium paragordonae]|uniref:NAD-dependent epimerase/dehydratase family protein n=1 Tax=Mycobacterium paragordonae TaxID=1389713 RepID=A0A4R5WUB9_9MYCO|nr:NAD-dependent epimerase/dehydratase family protein [Mycobacterium paragordonae]MDP7734128.1 NAD-dependent epimerase/dehydratase family protein [Mycobacterium paragordonae]TDK97268.1 NAD-dependent epimerase/dehydratase family protein [Mycobacterium paragordonae]TDK99069.1 NAD-dependent epimerase/dehydratase family protein [Mycobacterium paragordonae]TDL11113.1 NAD-dependent epimerase/dehydratase family protein [Mycobacterium paragordonae]